MRTAHAPIRGRFRPSREKRRAVGGGMFITSVRRLCGLAGLATLLLGFSVAAASAGPARVFSNTNLRQGPGTTFGVVAVVPGGTVVEVTGCSGEWCTANW